MGLRKRSISTEEMTSLLSASKYHSLRVHLQITGGKDLEGDVGRQTPITTDRDVAPDNLLNIIRCKYKENTYRKQCGRNTCSSRKHGLKCVAVCSGCYGVTCNNVEVLY